MPETDRSGEIGNCRIRTAFTLKNGKKVYFEAIAWKPSDEMIKAYNNAKTLQRGKNGERYLSQKLKPGKIYIAVDSLHYITDKTDENGINISDCNESRIIFNNDLSREWTKSDLLAFVNSLGADFDEVECLPDLAGYRVFADGIKQPQRNGNTAINLTTTPNKQQDESKHIKKFTSRNRNEQAKNTRVLVFM